MYGSSLSSKVLAFASEIGVPWRQTFDFDIAGDMFVDDVLIEAGKILIFPDAKPEDILHEVGHFALFPREFWLLLSGSLELCRFDLNRLKSKHPAFFDVCMGDETALLAWEWFAWKHLGVNCFEMAANAEVFAHYEEIQLAFDRGEKSSHVQLLEKVGMAVSGKITRWTYD